MNRTFRSANNYTETRLQRVGPTSYELWFNFVLRAGYFRERSTAPCRSVG